MMSSGALFQPGRRDIIEHFHLVGEVSLEALADALHVLQKLFGIIWDRFLQVFADAFSDSRRLSIGGYANLKIALGDDGAKIEIAKFWGVSYIDQQAPFPG